ncbi:hypothetical protein DERF_003668 [Dermatophagoides farinae]|uniref:Uncharacterized protein n=1 Tax=Dermatophagoides farinae TaxID=6954 RepID=A0A922IEM0_DERFA|nr:hypothetical protein DERF_003668 [Dermatophagoides farinae]
MYTLFEFFHFVIYFMNGPECFLFDSNQVVDDCKILGIHDGKLLIRIGDSFFFGHLDNRQQTSVLFAYEPNHKFIQEIHKSFSKIIMKRVILKPKEDKNQQQPTIIKMDTLIVSSSLFVMQSTTTTTN